MLLLLALSTSAQAGELTFRWDAPVPLHAEVIVDTPRVVTLLGTKNTDARVTSLQIAFDMTCSGVAAKRGWEVSCDVEGARIGGTAVPGEQDKLNVITAEYASILDAATIELGVATDGRLLSVDVEGVAKTDSRHADLQEALRQMVRRALAPLDMQMPKEGVDPGKPWRQTGTPLALEMVINVDGQSGASMSGTGVAGGADLKTKVDSRESSVVKLSTTGTGTTLLGESGKMVHMSVGAEARFDAARGALLYRFLVVDGVSSAASSMADSSGFYHQAGAIGYRNADGTMEGPDGPMGTAPKGP